MSIFFLRNARAFWFRRSEITTGCLITDDDDAGRYNRPRGSAVDIVYHQSSKAVDARAGKHRPGSAWWEAFRRCTAASRPRGWEQSKSAAGTSIFGKF